MPKSLKILYGVAGVVLLAFGLKAIFAEKIVTEGSRLRGAGWVLHGEAAIGVGAMIAALGIFVIYQALKNK